MLLRNRRINSAKDLDIHNIIEVITHKLTVLNRTEGNIQKILISRDMFGYIDQQFNTIRDSCSPENICYIKAIHEKAIQTLSQIKRFESMYKQKEDIAILNKTKQIVQLVQDKCLEYRYDY